MPSEPEITILMANYNNAGYIRQAIDSVLAQDFPDWELVIVDDDSSDNSIGIIEQKTDEPRIRFYRNEHNVGYTSTLKRMISLSRAEIVGILDSDDVLAERALSEVMQAFATDPTIGLVYTQNWRCDQDLKPIAQGYSGIVPEGKSNMRLNVIHHFRAFRKSEYSRTAGFDESIKYAEDIDLMLKLEEVTKAHFIDKPLYYYRILPKSQTHSFKNEMINRSSTALAKLNAYKRRQGTNIPNLDLDEIAEVLFFGTFTALLSGRWQLAGKLAIELCKNNPFFFLHGHFYCLAVYKTKKISNQKLASHYAKSDRAS